MFKSALLRLTGWYLLIIVVLSLLFSTVVYNLSMRELDNNLARQYRTLQRMPFSAPGFLEDFDQERQTEYEHSRSIVLTRLAVFNILTIAAGGLASYALARRTLVPIEEAVEAQSRFTSDASHELRTPLTAMQTEIEVALRDKKLSKQEAVELLESNLEEVNKLRSLSDGLLRLASSSNQALPEEVVSVDDIVSQAVKHIEVTAKKSGITISVPKSKSGLSVKGDTPNLVEMLSILLDNAIKYSPAKAAVEVSVLSRSQYVTINVIDHGIGILQTDLAHIFDRFYRADTSRSKLNVEGYGLGLAIAQQIAKMHNGGIEVTSTVGKGSTFSVRLPLAVSGTSE